LKTELDNLTYLKEGFKMNLAEQAHIVNILPPVDINAGVTSDYFSLKNYGHCSIIITAGVTGGTSDVTVEESTNNAGGATTAIGFSYYAETTDAGDTLGDRTTVDNGGFTTSANDNITYCIDIDATELTADYPYLVLKMADPSGATFAGAIAVLTEPRYGAENTTSAIV